MITNHHVGLACIQNVSTAEHDYVKDGFYAPTRDQEAACPGYEVNVLMKIEDVTSRVLGSVKAAMTDKEAGEAQEGGHGHDRERLQRPDRPSLRRGEAVPGRRVPPLPLQEVHGRAPRVRARAGDRLLRRRSRQLHLPPARPRRLALPRLRERTAGEARLVPEVEHDRRLRRRPRVRVGQSRVHVASEDTMAELAVGARRHRAREPSLARGAPLRAAGLLGEGPGERATRQGLDLRPRERQEGVGRTPRGAPGPEGHGPEGGGREDPAGPGGRRCRPGARAWATPGPRSRPCARRRTRARRKRATWALPDRSSWASPDRSCGSWPRCRSPTRCASRATSIRACPRSRTGCILGRLSSTTSKRRPSPISSSWPRPRWATRTPSSRPSSAGRPAGEVAKALVSGSKLKDPAVRQALVDGGAAAVAASTDPMIVVARKIDPLDRAVRKFYEDEVEAPITRSSERIAQARWKVYGKTVSPDATFTLRLAYGTVKGYPAEGTEVAPRTTFYGLFDRSFSHGGKAPWDLPARWLEKRPEPGPRHPAQLRLHERHHRRQLGQPGREPRRRVRGDHLRREHPEPGLGLLLHRGAGPLGVRRRPRHPRSLAQGLRRGRRWSRRSWAPERREDQRSRSPGRLRRPRPLRPRFGRRARSLPLLAPRSQRRAARPRGHPPLPARSRAPARASRQGRERASRGGHAGRRTGDRDPGRDPRGPRPRGRKAGAALVPRPTRSGRAGDRGAEARRPADPRRRRSPRTRGAATRAWTRAGSPTVAAET